MNDADTSPLRMPAEWEPHQATWLAWPWNRGDWPGRFGPIPWVYADILFQLHHCEEVNLLIQDAEAERSVRNRLARRGVDLQRVHFFQYATNRVWTRDYCPLFVFNAANELVVSDWHFNGWAKYDDWQRDDGVPDWIANTCSLARIIPEVHGRRVVLEGGSIDVNGAGLLLTTEECLLGPVQARNPDLTREDLEAILGRMLGVRKVLWLGRGIAGDDTHGHVDDLARFVGPRTVVTMVENNPADENYEPLQENLDRLRGMQDLDGAKLEVVQLPMPTPLYFAGQRLPASYANFYIANDRVLVPTFNDVNDRQALGILSELFPERQVIGIHAGDLVWGLGTLHCMTQQMPAVPK